MTRATPALIPPATHAARTVVRSPGRRSHRIRARKAEPRRSGAHRAMLDVLVVVIVLVDRGKDPSKEGERRGTSTHHLAQITDARVASVKSSRGIRGRG